MKTIIILILISCFFPITSLSQENIKFRIDDCDIRKYNTYKDLINHIDYYYKNIEFSAEFYVVLFSEDDSLRVSKKNVVKLNNRYDFEKFYFYLLNNEKNNESILNSLSLDLEIYTINEDVLHFFEKFSYNSFVDCKSGVINFDNSHDYELIYTLLSQNILVTRDNYSGDLIVGTEKILNVAGE